MPSVPPMRAYTELLRKDQPPSWALSGPRQRSGPRPHSACSGLLGLGPPCPLGVPPSLLWPSSTGPPEDPLWSLLGIEDATD